VLRYLDDDRLSANDLHLALQSLTNNAADKQPLKRAREGAGSARHDCGGDQGACKVQRTSSMALHQAASSGTSDGSIGELATATAERTAARVDLVAVRAELAASLATATAERTAARADMAAADAEREAARVDRVLTEATA